MSSIKKHIPQKTLGTRKDVPWMTPEIKRKIRKKQRLYNRQKNTGKANHKRKFKEIRKAVKRELNNAHNQIILLNFSRKLFFVKKDVEPLFFLKTGFKIGVCIIHG